MENRRLRGAFFVSDLSGLLKSRVDNIKNQNYFFIREFKEEKEVRHMAWELLNTHPFKDIEKVRSETDRLLDTFLFGIPQERDFRQEVEWLPAVDVTETRNEIVVDAEIPGMDPAEIDISLSEGTLTIKGKKKQEKEEKEENYHLIERRYGTFTRSIPLSERVESNKISASYKDGVLKIRLPKSEGAKKKEIKIKVE
jgi:HSP20 family protein